MLNLTLELACLNALLLLESLQTSQLDFVWQLAQQYPLYLVLSLQGFVLLSVLTKPGLTITQGPALACALLLLKHLETIPLGHVSVLVQLTRTPMPTVPLICVYLDVLTTQMCMPITSQENVCNFAPTKHMLIQLVDAAWQLALMDISGSILLGDASSAVPGGNLQMNY